MEWSKLKNVILLMLAIVNLFLLVLVVYRNVQSAQLEQSAREDVVQILEQNGIWIEEKTLFEPDAWPSLQVNWDRSQAQRIAESVLGHVTKEEQGNTVVYQGELGSAVFYGDGTMQITVNQPGKETQLSQQAAQERAQALLQQMGLKTEQLFKKETETGCISFSTVQQTEGRSVFNCFITITYTQEGTMSVEGICLLGEVKYTTVQQTKLSIFTAMTKLLQYEKKYPAGIQKIQSVQAGYLLPSIGSDTVQLEPFWRIETDKGTYDVSGLTGVIK